MSDARTRALEAAAQRGDQSAAVALARAQCRAGDHAWSCCDTTGAVVTYIWCIRCLARRPKDEHEIGVESYVARLADQARGAYGRAVRRHGRNGSAEEFAEEFERLQGEIGRLSGSLLDYRYAIAPHRLLMLPGAAEGGAS